MKNRRVTIIFLLFLTSFLGACQKIEIVEDEKEIQVGQRLDEIRIDLDKKTELTGHYTDKKLVGTAQAAENTLGESESLGQNRGRVLASSLNLRQAPDSTSQKIGSLLEGDLVEILGQEGNWYHIRKDGLEAYASKDFIDPLAEREEETQPTATPREEQAESSDSTYYVDVDLLNVRVYANQDAELRDQLKKDSRVEIILDTNLTGNEWVKIQYAGGSGYVVKEYLRK